MRPANALAEQIGAVERMSAGITAEITVYSRPDCHLCADAMAALRVLQDELGFGLTELDIDGDEALQRAYFERIPVIALDGEELFDHFIDESLLRERLESRR
jgi:glutaredoxin